MVRQAVAAGRFYDDDPDTLRSEIESFISGNRRVRDAVSVIVPHAGYIFSGKLASQTLSSVHIPQTVILLGPNHTGMGHKVSLSAKSWKIPFGTIDTDSSCIKQVLMTSDLAQIDETAHTGEHSLEVILPILHYLRPDVLIVPLTVGPLLYEECMELAETLADVIAQNRQRYLLVASNDMSHFISRKEAQEMDSLALSHISKLDPAGLYQTVHHLKISICGVYPVTTVLQCSKLLGASQVTQVGYLDSGRVTGDTDRVVAYAGLVIE